MALDDAEPKYLNSPDSELYRKSSLLYGLFQARAAPIRFLGQRLFRADIVFPANVPTGLYTVNVYLVKGGQVVSAATTPLSVTW